MASKVFAPRLAAGLVSLLLIGAGTAASLAGLQVLTPALPPSASGSYTHVHGEIVAVDTDGKFAVQVPGRQSWLWMQRAPDSRISMAHLDRHMSERAPTDVRYEVGPNGVLMAMDAD